jgi:hypothetical protein
MLKKLQIHYFYTQSICFSIQIAQRSASLPVTHRFFHPVIIWKSTSQSVHEGLKQMETGRRQVWAVGWVLENFPIQLLKDVDGVGCRMRARIVV